MKTSAKTFILLLIFWSCDQAKKMDSENHATVDSTTNHYVYEPNSSTLTGTLSEEIFWGPPNYGEDTTTDAKELCLILYLDKPINIKADGSNSYNIQMKDVKKIQLVTSNNFTNFIGKHVTVKGTLFGAHTGHHHTDVLLMTDTIISESTLRDAKDTVKMYTFPQPSIKGDFDGDGNSETLESKLYSKRDKNFMTEYPVDCEMGCICEYDPELFLKCNKTNFPTLFPGEKTLQLYGLAKLSNIGDVNLDGTDEIALIINYASYSGLNTCYIYTLCNNKWTQLFSFCISEQSLFENGQYCPKPYDISKHVFQKNGRYYYSIFAGDKNVIKQLPEFPACAKTNSSH